ncbi:MAG: hypothetical protein AB7Y46_11810 [Armatimonadota bacterium]
MVTHIVIPPAPAPEDEPPRPWPPDDPRYNVLTDPRVSVPIKMWALLHIEPHTVADMCDFLGVGEGAVYAALHRLRAHGQRLVRQRAVYSLEPTGPLGVADLGQRGVVLHPRNSGSEVICSHIVCHVSDGLPQIEVIEQPGPERVERAGGAGCPRWRPVRGDFARSGGLQEQSIAVWVWGLLKTGTWRLPDLANELGVSQERVTTAISHLRVRGHALRCDMSNRYYMRDDGRPLRVVERGGRLVLARMDDCNGGRDFDLW